MLGLNSVGQQQFDLDIICASVSSVVVALRVLCKVRHKQGIKPDDWCIVAALVCYWGSVGCVTWGRVEWGAVEDLTMVIQAEHGTAMLKHMSTYTKTLLIGNAFLVTAFYACWLSVLIFYRRLFFVSGTYRHISLAIIVVSTAWCVVKLTVNWLLCIPIQAFWDRTLAGKCIDINAFCLAAGIIDTIVDLLIILLPVRMALGLCLPKKTRVAVAGLFALGGFVVLTDIMRTNYMYRPGQAFISTIEAERWSNIHMLTVFVCACLPVYKPLWSSFTSTASGWMKRCGNQIRPSSGGKYSKTKTRVSTQGVESVGTVKQTIKEMDLERGDPSKSSTTRSSGDCRSDRALYY